MSEDKLHLFELALFGAFPIVVGTGRDRALEDMIEPERVLLGVDTFVEVYSIR